MNKRLSERLGVKNQAMTILVDENMQLREQISELQGQIAELKETLYLSELRNNRLVKEKEILSGRVDHLAKLVVKTRIKKFKEPESTSQLSLMKG